MVAAIVGLACAPTVGLAQADGAPCPDLDPDATAAEHAVCWFDRHDVGESDCQPDGSDECLQQAVHWCESAALDDPRVANACFLAPLRAGAFETASEVAEYVTEPSPETQRCREAVTGMLTVRIVTTPEGGEVTVDGRAYGAAPVEVSLPSPWWERRIEVTFGDTQVEVSKKQLTEAFDARACKLGDVVVEGPERAAEPAAATPPGDEPETEPGNGLTVLGWTLVGAGGAMGITALATGLVADSKYGDLNDECTDGICAPEHK
ncbi:MAG: PEGA domain-containing protein, partial [Gemmatimonadota bacterium]